jgi:hypothetical protein
MGVLGAVLVVLLMVGLWRLIDGDALEDGDEDDDSDLDE